MKSLSPLVWHNSHYSNKSSSEIEGYQRKELQLKTKTRYHPTQLTLTKSKDRIQVQCTICNKLEHSKSKCYRRKEAKEKLKQRAYAMNEESKEEDGNGSAVKKGASTSNKGGSSASGLFLVENFGYNF